MSKHKNIKHRDGFTFFKSYDDVMQNLNDKQFLLLMRTILDVQFLRVKYENVTIIAEIVDIGTDEKVTGIDFQGSLGAGVEYKEEWDSDDKGTFKTVTVTFTGCTASFYIYASITKRKKRVVQGEETEQSYNKQIGKKYSEILLEKATWYGPEKIYIDDEK